MIKRFTQTSVNDEGWPSLGREESSLRNINCAMKVQGFSPSRPPRIIRSKEFRTDRNGTRYPVEIVEVSMVGRSIA